MSYTIRPDARPKLRGEVRYGADLEVPGMLWGALVPAPVSRGRIRSLDLGPARAIEGVVAIGPAELATLLTSPGPESAAALFPVHEIQYHGQPLAAVAARTLAEARRAAAAVRLDVEGRAPIGEVDAFDPGRPAARGHEVIGHVHARHGDVGAAFAAADLVLSETYRTSGVHQVALEPHACLAEVDGATWKVRTNTQTPFGVREDVAAALGIPEERLVVEASWIGGAFGGKGAPLLEPYALLLAKASGRPVRLALTYREEFRIGRTSLPSYARIETAVRGGRISGRRVHWRLDSGAALPGRDFATGFAAPFLLGPYRIPAYDLEAFALRTNKPPFGPHRAPMAPQCAFVVESHMDHLADRLGVDPVAFRRAHVWKEGDRTHLGQAVGPFGLDACLDAAGRLGARWRAESRGRTGVGVAAGYWSTGTGAGGEARLILSPTDLAIVQGEREIGSGSVLRGLARVAERVLGLPPERVRVDYRDTREAPFDSGVYGSRTVGALGQAVEKASRALLEEIGRRTGVPAASVRLSADGPELAVIAGPSRRPLSEILTAPERAAGGLVREGRHYGTPGAIDAARVLDGTFYPYMDFTGAAHVAEVSVDPETGTTRVLRYAAFQDVGAVIDPPTARASVEGGVAMGLGTALAEEMLWSEDGTLANPGLRDYRIPTLGEVPPIAVELLEGFPGAGPFGAKGLGEPPIIPVPAAIGNAIFAASRAALTELPMTPERVARALKLL